MTFVSKLYHGMKLAGLTLLLRSACGSHASSLKFVMSCSCDWKCSAHKKDFLDASFLKELHRKADEGLIADVQEGFRS